ncbi:MAG: hypothetical protein BWY80_01344 [Firmicutes bacterium ADurb.Bin456]|nr:MAG: hypothetical protein BWY80_01344 [Firmicutes bacterium ADurb.Bin456]
MQEPGSHGTVGILKTNRDEADFLAGHFGPGPDCKISAGAGAKGRVPTPAQPLPGGTRFKDSHRTPHSHQDRPGLEHIKFILAHAEAYRPGNSVALQQRFQDKDTLVDIFPPEGISGSLGNNNLVGLTV